MAELELGFTLSQAHKAVVKSVGTRLPGLESLIHISEGSWASALGSLCLILLRFKEARLPEPSWQGCGED